MKKNLPIKAALLSIIATLLASCGAFQPKQKVMPPIRVEFTQWWGDYTLLVAQEKGFFKNNGVNVEPVFYEIFSDSYSDLAAGQIDASLIAMGDVMNINRHTPVIVIGLEDDGGNMSIVAVPEIKSIRDLKGKTVGTLIGTQYELLVADMLASAGMSVADITLLNMDPEQATEALLKNEIQAAFIWEPFTSQSIKEARAHILYPTDASLRLFPDVIVFRESVVKQRPEEIRAFMKAWFEALDYMSKNPEETRQIAAKYTGIPVEQIEPDASLKRFTLQDNIAAYKTARNETNSIFNIAQKTADYLISNGSLISVPNLENIITPEFLPQN